MSIKQITEEWKFYVPSSVICTHLSVPWGLKKYNYTGVRCKRRSQCATAGSINIHKGDDQSGCSVQNRKLLPMTWWWCAVGKFSFLSGTYQFLVAPLSVFKTLGYVLRHIFHCLESQDIEPRNYIGKMTTKGKPHLRVPWHCLVYFPSPLLIPKVIKVAFGVHAKITPHQTGSP